MGAARDRVMETSTTTGTGDITLGGAVAGFRTFTSAIGLSVFFDYCIEAVDGNAIPTGEWEVGEGYLSAGTVLVRAVVGSSSNANALVSLSAGTKRVFITFAAGEMQNKSHIAARSSFLALN